MSPGSPTRTIVKIGAGTVSRKAVVFQDNPCESEDCNNAAFSAAEVPACRTPLIVASARLLSTFFDSDRALPRLCLDNAKRRLHLQR